MVIMRPPVALPLERGSPFPPLERGLVFPPLERGGWEGSNTDCLAQEEGSCSTPPSLPFPGEDYYGLVPALLRAGRSCPAGWPAGGPGRTSRSSACNGGAARAGSRVLLLPAPGRGRTSSGCCRG